MLPRVDDAASFEGLRRDEGALGPGVEALCRRLGLAGEPRARFADGSLPVYALGATRVLKLYPPCFPGEAAIERAALELVAGRIPIPTPAVEAAGGHDGWDFVLMSRLRGESLATAWPSLDAGAREGLLGQLGEGLAALHALGVPAGPIPRPAWGEFLAAQRAGVLAQQRRGGLDARWLAQLEAYLDGVPLDAAAPAGMLHTEVMREHLLVAEGPRGWALTGLFDFEPCMVGATEYEFASAGIFVCGGDPALLRRLLWSYGYPAAALDEDLSRRLLAYALLHRYSNLRWYLERIPPAPQTRTLDALARSWWGV